MLLQDSMAPPGTDSEEQDQRCEIAVRKPTGVLQGLQADGKGDYNSYQYQGCDRPFFIENGEQIGALFLAECGGGFLHHARSQNRGAEKNQNSCYKPYFHAVSNVKRLPQFIATAVSCFP